jgi:hypothetical protein
MNCAHVIELEYVSKISMFTVKKYFVIVYKCYMISILHEFFFPLALQPKFGPWPSSMKLSVSLRFTRS